MGLAPAAHVLFNKFMTFNPKNPDWVNRDRFVLSYVFGFGNKRWRLNGETRPQGNLCEPRHHQTVRSFWNHANSAIGMDTDVCSNMRSSICSATRSASKT